MKNTDTKRPDAGPAAAGKTFIPSEAGSIEAGGGPGVTGAAGEASGEAAETGSAEPVCSPGFPEFPEPAEQLPPCIHREGCGGCLYQGIPYEEQLREKEKQVLMLLSQNGVDCQIFSGIEKAPSPYRYRNKMEYTFGDLEKGGEMTLGMHQKKRFMSILTTDRCQLVDDDFNQILAGVLRWCREKNYPFYHKKTHEGFLRHLILRKGERTKELLINLVTSSSRELDEAGFCALLLDMEKEGVLQNRIAGILHTINDRMSDFAYCDAMKTLWGRNFYMEEILGLKFKVNAFSFFQTNVAAAERLYREALELIPQIRGKTVYDLYCGTGTITQAMALKAKKVIGVEISGDSAAAARENAALNGLDNCLFLEGDVFAVLDRISEPPEVIVLDPPRAGITPKSLAKILAYGVPEILYISCNPKTMAANLAAMQEGGYRAESIRAYDNFGFTRHVETVVLMSKVKE